MQTRLPHLLGSRRRRCPQPRHIGKRKGQPHSRACLRAAGCGSKRALDQPQAGGDPARPHPAPGRPGRFGMTAEGDFVRTLTAEGRLRASSITNAGCVVRDVSQRNRVFLIESDGEAPIFLKMPGDHGGPAIAREAAQYASLERVPEFREFIPRMRYDARSSALVFEAGHDMVDLWEFHTACGSFPRGIPAQIGRALGVLHRATRVNTTGDTAATGGPAWVLDVHRPTPSSFSTLTEATTEFIAALQSSPDTLHVLDRLHREWSVAALIHGDVKWPNILTNRAPGDPPFVKLIDWEHAALGDPAWDVGSALASYLSFWVRSLPLGQGWHAVADLAEGARYPLETMRPALRACWSGYVEHAQVGSSQLDAFREKTSLMVGARLIQAAFESTQTAAVLHAGPSLHLQLAMNILARPAAAATELLGLPSAAE
jgi:Phosphotransferase enzyme family